MIEKLKQELNGLSYRLNRWLLKAIVLDLPPLPKNVVLVKSIDNFVPYAQYMVETREQGYKPLNYEDWIRVTVRLVPSSCGEKEAKE